MSSQHKTILTWKRATPDFAYDTYDRTHLVTFEGGTTVRASSAPDFLGKRELANPEEMLVAALSSCHMLTFLAIAAKSRLIVDSYEDHAVGYLEKNGEGKLWLSRVELRPRIVFSGSVPDSAKIQSLHEKSHHNCFIANSVKTEVTVLGV